MTSSIAWLLGWLLGLALVANGLIMLTLPAIWYAHVPGVVDTGPFNAHFVREIGAAYLICGLALMWFAMRPVVRPAAQIGAAFLAVHALIHLWDTAAGCAAVEQLLVDVPTVLLPPALAIWITWSPSASDVIATPRSKAR
jgi:hypothetical protein